MKKRHAILFSSLLCGALLLAPPAHAQLGIAAGANFNALSDVETGDFEATFQNASGWHFGLWYDLAMGPLALRAGLRYMDVGQLYEEFDFQGHDLSANYSLALVEVPVDVRVRVPAPLITPYLLAGPVLRFSAGEEGGDEVAESFSFAGGLGAGLELGLGGLRLFPELRYTFGLTRFTKDTYTVGGVEFSPDDSQQLNTFMLSLGIGL